MSKRRTRKDKETAKHHFTISWKPEAKNRHFEPNVNRQKQTGDQSGKSKDLKIEFAENRDKSSNLASVKKDILKSLVLALLILSSELMLYLFLKSR